MARKKRIEIGSKLFEELISEILSRIPAEDLIRFKTVSKLWYSIISDPKFVNAHLSHSRPSIILPTIRYNQVRREGGDFVYYSLNLQQKTPKLQKFQLPENLLKQKVLLETSTDGLILLRGKDDRFLLYVCNPVTRRCVSLPPVQDLCADWALVYDSSIGKYKVFGIACGRNICMVLTQGENAWKEVNIVRTIPGLFSVLTELTLVDNKLYWLTKDADDSLLRDGDGDEDEEDDVISDTYYINSIGVATGEFRRSKLPPNIAHDRNFLSEMKGSLYLTSVSRYQIDIWVLDDLMNSQWSKCYGANLQSIKKPSFLLNFLDSSDCVVAIRDACGSSFEEIQVKILIHHIGQLYVYDLKRQNMARIKSISKYATLCQGYVQHKSSLVGWK